MLHNPYRFFHPEDWDRIQSETEGKFLSGTPHEMEARLRRNDDAYC
jgi:hypothetical protein